MGQLTKQESLAVLIATSQRLVTVMPDSRERRILREAIDTFTPNRRCLSPGACVMTASCVNTQCNDNPDFAANFEHEKGTQAKTRGNATEHQRACGGISQE